MRIVLLMLFLAPFAAATADTECPLPLHHTLQKLNSSETVNLCQFGGQPLLVVNTASHCGFTRQFEGLQTLYSDYHERGLNVLGVPSNDFRQEARDEKDRQRLLSGLRRDFHHDITAASAWPRRASAVSLPCGRKRQRTALEFLQIPAGCGWQRSGCFLQPRRAG